MCKRVFAKATIGLLNLDGDVSTLISIENLPFSELPGPIMGDTVESLQNVIPQQTFGVFLDDMN